MSLEERIERLTGRHEALAESAEMFRGRTDETAGRLDRLEGRVDRLTEQLEKLSGQVERLAENTLLNFDRLTSAMLGLTEHITGQERRNTGLGGSA